MVSNKQKAVSFNIEQQQLYKELRKKGLISQKFNDFVKDAFHDKIDNIKMKQKR